MTRLIASEIHYITIFEPYITAFCIKQTEFPVGNIYRNYIIYKKTLKCTDIYIYNIRAFTLKRYLNINGRKRS